ncbi:hypothetical protein ACLVLO_10575, partial [Streptococcus pneumoniae]
MGVRIENNLFYVESKNLSLIIENRNGYLLLKHLGKTIKNYKPQLFTPNLKTIQNPCLSLDPGW